MRVARQVMWIGLVGVLLGGSAVATRASVRIARAYERPSRSATQWRERRLNPTLSAVDDSIDDDDAPEARVLPPARQRPTTLAWHSPRFDRAPVASPNLPVPRRLKLPAPDHGDVPLH